MWNPILYERRKKLKKNEKQNVVNFENKNTEAVVCCFI